MDSISESWTGAANLPTILTVASLGPLVICHMERCTLWQSQVIRSKSTTKNHLMEMWSSSQVGCQQYQQTTRLVEALEKRNLCTMLRNYKLWNLVLDEFSKVKGSYVAWFSYPASGHVRKWNKWISLTCTPRLVLTLLTRSRVDTNDCHWMYE